VSRFLEELLNPWRDDLAALVARGVQEGAFAPPADDFNRRFIALLDGLALQRLQRMEETSRRHLTELAMHAARIELAPASRARILPRHP
jgi:BetI-type transcriptional repressor, C-terminal